LGLVFYGNAVPGETEKCHEKSEVRTAGFHTSYLPYVDRCMNCVDWLHQLHWLFYVDWCERIRKEAFLASFKLLSLQLPGGADKNHEYLRQASSFPTNFSWASLLLQVKMLWLRQHVRPQCQMAFILLAFSVYCCNCNCISNCNLFHIPEIHDR